jgi:REP element-mobilizing transposase RayT
MGYARKNLVSLEDTPYYHCIARCVRRAWLWGMDEYAQKDYSHRKQWVLSRLEHLGSMFAIEVCAYAVMSNHYHLVLYVDAEKASKWTQQEVIERWTRLFSAPTLVQRWLNAEALDAEQRAAEAIIEQWRSRLHDVSWFMRCLNEHLARLANAEDDCTGRFWEGRFKSQALLDEAGLLTAMAYVDLNPVRAGIAPTPQDSQFTSIYDRISRLGEPRANPASRIVLRKFRDEAATDAASIPFTLREYLALVDWTGRAIRARKRGLIDASIPAGLLNRLSIEPDSWEQLMTRRGTLFGRAMGRVDAMRLHAATLGQAWIHGVRQAERIYSR